MSAWIVDKKHIDLMVKGFIEGARGGPEPIPTTISTDALGQLLVDECVASVSHRYPRDKPGELPGPCDPYYLKPYTYEDPEYRPTAVELFAAIRCYVYQSCEHPGWKDSKAAKWCQDQQDLLGNQKEAPEYDNAPWGFGEEKIAECKRRLELSNA